jgi:hypothetical protein
MSAKQLQKIHLTAAGIWLSLGIPTVFWWKESVLWVAIMSLWANFVGHLGAYDAARAEES